jgi:hypothetical protein
VVYALDAADWPELDRCEGGYDRVAVEVLFENGERFAAETYVAVRMTADAVAFDWYVQIIVDGAAAHELPEPYLAELRALPVRPDPSRVS